ncbi:helix-turn-helix transcriptional regulator [Brevibacillus centrosporus]|uniref:helix-turn-helix domain-containing protein n=1 Tax=Brevibacillus centrosporus TaxID=54910 RepID=UPI000F09B638|nr:helix-turn-helix transcriptional regulator [Brevibacillus centrosporus]MEC2133481.1 helix-turn-helix transcriptional regulator [Brevibacillus centrosporus]RNB64198.1 XRE family transcriptional regulator [Brevibacillus centrosporus]GED35000.1 transcriptional regulator [Brevibacillus centrosporus]
MSIGEKIKSYRKKTGLTQAMLADKANMSRSYLADVERDRYNPSVDTLKAIADALNIPLTQLLDDESSIHNPNDLSPKEERDIAIDLEKMVNDLHSSESLGFYGEAMDEESKELLRISLENTLRLAKQMAKQKFTPKKHRK